MRMNNEDRNHYVKAQITKATLKLLKTKDLADISIGEITETAQVSRVSFYRNYDSKEAIVREKVHELFTKWAKGNEYIKIKEETGNDDLMLADLFGFLKTNDKFFLLLKKRSLLYLLRDELKSMIGPKPEDGNAAAYFGAFAYNGIYGWIDEWINRGMQEDKVTMAKMMQARNLSLEDYHSKKDFQ